MFTSGESQKGVFRPDFNRVIMIDFLGAQISSDTGFILIREIDERFNIINPMGECALEFIRPMMERYRAWFKLFWFRGDAAFAKPEIYEYCEEQRITYFTRLPANENWISWWRLTSVVQ
jgi:hypothetical protein